MNLTVQFCQPTLSSIELIANLRFTRRCQWDFLHNNLKGLLLGLDLKYKFDWDSIDLLYHGPGIKKQFIVHTSVYVRIEQLQHFYPLLQAEEIALIKEMIVRIKWYYRLDEIEQKPTKFLTHQENFVRTYAAEWIKLKEQVWWRKILKNLFRWK